MSTRPTESFPITVLLAIAGLFFFGGCLGTVPADKFQAVQRQLQLTQEQVRMLESKAAAQQETIHTLKSQIANVRRIKGDLADTLPVPVKIELASLSGGYDADGKVGDEGLVLYVQPIDRDQHVVKAAGTLTVRLLDPQNPPGSIEYAKYYYDLKKTRELWHGRLMTNHFTVRCPWHKNRLPTHKKIIAHVVFTDLLTGKALSTEESFDITFPLDHIPTEDK